MKSRTSRQQIVQIDITCYREMYCKIYVCNVVGQPVYLMYSCVLFVQYQIHYDIFTVILGTVWLIFISGYVDERILISRIICA